MSAPISFIIPAYNCAPTVAQSVESIVDGNLNPGDEIVIVDDGSMDQTAQVLAQLAAAHPAVRLVPHRRNKGGGAARNTAVEHARHDLIFCLDSDNLLVPGSIARLQHYMLTQQADAATFRESRMFKTDPAITTLTWRYRDGQLTFADYLAGIVVPGASGNYLYSRDSWLKAGGYPEFSGALDTWGFGLRQVATGQKVMIMSDGFYCHRHGHESYWTREAAKGRISLTALQILIPYLDQVLDEDVDYIMGRDTRLNWHGLLDHRPIRLADGTTGRGGVILDEYGHLIPFFASLPHNAPVDPIADAQQTMLLVFEMAHKGQLAESDYQAVLDTLSSGGNHDMAQALSQAWNAGRN